MRTSTEYYRAEWRAFRERGSPLADLVARTAGPTPRRILDVGCGAGQELLPYLESGLATGVDIDRGGLAIGLELLRGEPHAGKPPTLSQAAAEELPFRDGAFDLVMCRIALPYTDNSRSIAEMARVLAPGGALVLKVHHLRYYLRQVRRAVGARDARSLLHALRVIAFGAVFETTGWQPALRRPGGTVREVFQLLGSLGRRLERHGILVSLVADRDAATPTLVGHKQAGSRAVG